MRKAFVVPFVLHTNRHAHHNLAISAIQCSFQRHFCFVLSYICWTYFKTELSEIARSMVRLNVGCCQCSTVVVHSDNDSYEHLVNQ